jgi:uncharacterized protein
MGLYLRLLRAMLAALVVSVVSGGAANAETCLAVDAEGTYSATRHVQCLREQSEQGDAEAQYLLGSFYLVGTNVPRDYQEAYNWLHRAADQGQPMAQFLLASMYASGRGVPRDLVHAHMWLNLAAAQGLELAQKAREELATNMTSSQITEAQKLAREWKPKVER